MVANTRYWERMIDLIERAKKGLKQRNQQIGTILQKYESNHKQFLEKKNQLSVELKGFQEQTLEIKLRENWDHLELRVKEGCMPRMELQKEFENIKRLLKCFESSRTQLTQEHLKNYDELCNLHTENCTKEKDTLGKHERNILSFEEDFGVLSNFKIKKYMELKADYERKAEEARNEIMQAVDKLIDEIK